ncbi:DUF1173 family protein [Undibacterium oligocarboniphilum]|uniref:DUF1173 family protein n=1 Tax=Undibacterium oligocarboniphilum TaxID=666702 RepID=A0A850QK35_9BURK|nr:DUF1173 family protein [Undibacterium oligocarboniphilum]MBC3871783.1 DUF1173 family protein [Undibacterium oligocarboniphilum]NVO79419.1 DUF1173 family protein [Undibacterium oligocarboniphilum]
MSAIFRVLVNNQTYTDRSSHALQSALSHAYHKSEAFCMCHSQPVKLIIKCYHKGTLNVMHGLARWPETGFDHHQDCLFFGDNPIDRLQHALPAVVKTEEGLQRIYLEAGLELPSKASVPGQLKSFKSKSAEVKRNRLDDATLLNTLWRTSSLNIFRGKSTQWFQACYAILNAAKRFIINQSGATLDQYLLIAAANHDKLINAHNQTVMAHAGNGKHQLLVIGRLHHIHPEKKRQILPLKEFSGIPRISVQREQLESFLNAHQHVGDNSIGQTSKIMLARIAPDNKEWWNCESLNGMITDQNLIPCNSIAELAFAAFLVSQERRFVRIIHEGPDDLQSRCQFILIDGFPRTYCEVFDSLLQDGVDNIALRGKFFEGSGKRYLSWIREDGSPFPTLPEVQN